MQTRHPAEFIEQFDNHPFHKQLGLRLIEAKGGYGKIALTKDQDTPGGIGGSVHGGILATMVDVVTLVALFSEPREGEVKAGTAELGITYLRQAHGKQIFAEGRVIKRGRQLASVEVDISDEEGRLCARGRTLYAFRAGQ